MDSKAILKWTDDHVVYWQPVGVHKYLATSGQNFVGLLEDGETVLKYPHRKTPEALSCLRAEADRYACLGPHDNLVICKGLNQDGLLLEYCELGGLDKVIEGPVALNVGRKALIGEQIVRCLVFLHGRRFIHCDLHIRNVFLTSKMVAKVGDIQGQLYRDDGSIEMETMSQENARSRHPYAGEDEFTHRTDIFALGTLLYHLWHGHPPFPEFDEAKQSDLITARYRDRRYPDDMAREMGIDVIIRKCWDSEYEHASEILDEMYKLKIEEVL